MEKTINIKTEEFKNSLYSLINNSGLPVANAYFVFKLVSQQLQKQYYDALNAEIAKMQQEKQQNE